jgi:hypothetical protein
MAVAAAAAAAAPEQMDPATENDIAQFVRLDVEMKRARTQMKKVGETLNDHRQNIIKYMLKTGIDKLVGINGGTQYLECMHKTLKRRPTSEQILLKLTELIEAGVSKPETILEAIQNCGGTYAEYRLARRTRRISAASAVAAVVAASKKKIRDPSSKKKRLEPHP